MQTFPVPYSAASPVFADAHKHRAHCQQVFDSLPSPSGRERDTYEFLLVEGSLGSPSWWVRGLKRALAFKRLTGLTGRRIIRNYKDERYGQKKL